jgi:hypothetical protein
MSGCLPAPGNEPSCLIATPRYARVRPFHPLIHLAELRQSEFRIPVRITYTDIPVTLPLTLQAGPERPLYSHRD